MSSAATRKPVDLAHLARYTGGEAQLDAEVLGLFVRHAADTLARLGALLDARDSKAWREATHTLKGAAMGIGAFPLAESAASAESVDPAGARTRAARALCDLVRNFDIVKGFVDAYLAR